MKKVLIGISVVLAFLVALWLWDGWHYDQTVNEDGDVYYKEG